MSLKVGQEPFNRLVRLAARAFYDDFTTKGDNLPRTRSDNRGIAVIILDALTKRQWVREEDLAKDLKIHMKQLRRTLRFFEEEKLIMRDHRKETAKGVKLHSAAVAATSDAQPHGKEGEDKIKLHTHSYCCLDYAQIYDVIRYRMHRMKKKLKDELESKNTIQKYICPNCNKRYTALDAGKLVSMEDEYFHCENCNGELVAESEKLASQDGGDGDDNARRQRREKLKELLQKVEEQLKPVVDQLNALKDVPVPEFGTLQAWEVRASHAANGLLNRNDGYRSNQGPGATTMPYLEETKIEVTISDAQATEHGNKAAGGNAPMKVLPPWILREGMNLTKEQRGEEEEAKEEDPKMESTASDDKKSDNKDDAKSYPEEILKAYYAALYQKQLEAAQSQQQESSKKQADNLESSSQRQVGMKSKREEEEVEWEEGGTDTTGNTTNYKVTDLNLEAVPTPTNVEEDDDDLDWEEG